MMGAMRTAVPLAILTVLLRAGATSAQPAAPTFNRDVAPIFFANCTTCHRPGEAAPMSLLTYKDTRPWVRSIAAQVKSGTMPPWHADPAIGHFANERRTALTSLQRKRRVHPIRPIPVKTSPR